MISNRFSPTNSATGSVSIIQPSGALCCFPTPRRPGNFSAIAPPRKPRWPSFRRRPCRHPLALSRSRRLRKHRHNQWTNSPRQSLRAREYSSPRHRIIRHRNFRRPRSSRRRRHRLRDRRNPRRLELQCNQSAVAVRRLLRDRASSYKPQLQDLCRAARRTGNPGQRQRSDPRPVRPTIGAHVPNPRRKHKFQPSHPPRLALSHLFRPGVTSATPPKQKRLPGGTGAARGVAG